MSRFENKPVGFFVLAAAVAVGLVICVFSFVSAGSKSSALEETVAANAATLDELRAEYDRLSGSASTAADSASASRVSPVAVGRAVATYQNRYYDMRVNTLSSEPTEYETVIADNAKAVGAYLESDSQAATGVWFACDDLKSRFQWTFRSGYVCEGEEMECLWTCEDKNGFLVAFAVGTYHAGSNKFGDVRVYVTQYGLSSYQVADSQATVFDDSYLDSMGVGSGPSAQTGPGSAAEDPPGGDASGNPDEGSTWAEQMEQAFKDSDAYKEQMKNQGG